MRLIDDQGNPMPFGAGCIITYRPDYGTISLSGNGRGRALFCEAGEHDDKVLVTAGMSTAHFRSIVKLIAASHGLGYEQCGESGTNSISFVFTPPAPLTAN